MLIDNIKFLLKYDRTLRNELKRFEDDGKSNVELIVTKNGQYTLQISQDERKILIHSKYDPVKEAERLIDQYADNINEYNHVFFYGVGLGYHVEAFFKKYKNLSFTLYEPNPYIFNHFLSVKKLEDLPIKMMKHLFVETSELKAKQFLEIFANNLQGNILYITLPSYNQAFSEQYKFFLNNYKDSLINKRSSLRADAAFEKRWTLNSLMNFSEVLKTPNVLHDVDKNHFKDKPAIIVAAGPSLNEELENLRYIKENGLAYIFAVGSANKTLIKNNITPDAVCTYDPKESNYLVFEELIEEENNTIPMIFGSSVGYETVEKYKGPKLHMITSQDSVSIYYLNDEINKNLNIVNDAPSIAVVTFQMLTKLQANPIILVGQNLAYKDNLFYSQGIEYESRKSKLEKNEIENAIKIKDVNGNDVLTNDTFLSMKRALEKYILLNKKTQVFNTTKGGAHIEGTTFITLDEVIKKYLKTKVVFDGWYKNISNKYSLENIQSKKREMDDSFESCKTIINHFINTLKNIQNHIKQKNYREIENQFLKIDKVYKQLTNNVFYQVFLKPMTRVLLEVTASKIKEVRFHQDVIYKGKVVADTYGRYIDNCNVLINEISIIYKKIKL